MADECMALFEAEISNVSLPAEEKQIDKQAVNLKRGRMDSAQGKELEGRGGAELKPRLEREAVKNGCTDAAQEKQIEEAREVEAKPSLAKDAVRKWKQRRINEELELEEKGKGAWTKHKDPGSGALYYYNKVTKKSSWSRPSDFVEPPAVSTEPVVVADTAKWTVSKDPASGLLYFYNKESGQSTWERPADFSKAAAPAVAAATTAATAGSSADAAATTIVGSAGAATLPSDADLDVDEVIDLVKSTKPSALSASDQVYARVVAESEDGISIVGFNLRLNTTFWEMMEAWGDYQELPAESIYFDMGGRVLAPNETPAHLGWTPERGTLKIEAKPCEEVTDEEAEEEEDARSKKKSKKQRKKEKKQQEKVEFITEF